MSYYYYQHNSHRFQWPLSVALFNFGGLGIGYFLLHDAKKGISYFFETLVVLFLLYLLAPILKIPAIPLLIFLVLVSLPAAVSGWKDAKSLWVTHSSPSKWYIPIAIALVVLIIQAGAYLIYRTAGIAHMDKAQTAYQEANFDIANKEYKLARNIFRLSFDSRLKQSKSYANESKEILSARQLLAENYFDSAISHYEDIISTYPKSIHSAAVLQETIQAYVQKANNLLSSQHFDEAIAVFSTLETNHFSTDVNRIVQEGGFRIYSSWAETLRSQNDFSGALAKYEELEARYSLIPENKMTVKQLKADTLEAWAQQLISTNAFELAITKLEEIRADYPGAKQVSTIETQIADVYALWAEDLYNKEDYAGSIEKIFYLSSNYSNQPCTTRVRSLLEEIFPHGVAAFENKDYCTASTILLPFAIGAQEHSSEADQLLPEALYNCGQTQYFTGKFTKAIESYQTLMERYPDSTFYKQAEAAIVDARVADIRTGRTGDLPQPSESGYASAGTTVVIVSNDAPERVEILMSGETSTSYIFEVCESCVTYGIVGPVYCPEEGPQKKFILKPGKYDVVAQTPDDPSITPFYGTWELESGKEYFFCFYIQSY
jgi:outer membrane protein assembly factor BamD (BamD/ComL family)